MNRITAAIILILVSLCVVGCGTSGSTLNTDAALLAQLHNDSTPEFLLEGVYYSLPVRAEVFLEQGWTMTVDDYTNQEVILQPRERVSATLEKGGNKINALLVNDSLLPQEAGKDCHIVQIYLFAETDSLPADFFITKYGISCASSPKDVKKALQDKEGYKESSDRYYLTAKGDAGTLDILSFSSKNGHTSIRIEAASSFAYRQYKPLEEKAREQAENIAKYKANAEKECLADYDQIVETLASKMTVPFCSLEGTVIMKGRGNYEGMEDNLFYGQDLSLYVVEDSSGQIYCIYEGLADQESVLKLPEMAEGDVIALWGFASKITNFSDGTQVPTVIPKIIEKDGHLFYLAEDLQTK